MAFILQSLYLLPPAMQIKKQNTPYYDRTQLIKTTTTTRAARELSPD